jgi:hypothetical protein
VIDIGESPLTTVHVTDVTSPAFTISSPKLNGKICGATVTLKINIFIFRVIRVLFFPYSLTHFFFSFLLILKKYKG